MTKRTYVVAAVGLAAVLAAGGLFASNMGFKLTYALNTTGGGTPASASGQNMLGLPYFPMTTITDANALVTDINTINGAAAATLQEFLPDIDALGVGAVGAGARYAGLETDPFPPPSIDPCACYLIQVASTTNYPVVGSHDPTQTCQLNTAGSGTPASASGQTLFAPPYHVTAADFDDLITDIVASSGGSPSVSVQEFLPDLDCFGVGPSSCGARYAGLETDSYPPPSLTPGDCYVIQTDTNITYTPSHY